MNNTQPVQPTLTPEQDINTRLMAQETILRFLAALLSPDQTKKLTFAINNTCEQLTQRTSSEEPGDMLQREYTIHLLKTYLPNR